MSAHKEGQPDLIKKPPIARYAEGLTEEQIKKLVEAEVGTQIERLKDYYRRGYPTFEMTGGNDLAEHDLAEFQLDTKSGQGILFTNTGNAKVLGNASLELISNGKKTGKGGFDKDGEAGVVIYAKDGVIHIESVLGTVNIKALNNIQLEAGKDINLIAKRNLRIDVGSNMATDVVGSCSEDVGQQRRMVSGGTMTLHSTKEDIQTSCGSDPAVCDFHEELKTDWPVVEKLASD